MSARPRPIACLMPGELVDKRLMDAAQQRRITRDGERVEPAFLDGKLRDLACFGFDVQAQHIEIRRYGDRAVRNIERKGGHPDGVAGCERGDAVTRKRPHDEARARSKCLVVASHDVPIVVGDGVDPDR